MEKKLYIETYGCQMNFSDSEIVASILKESGHTILTESEGADLILINTCSVRDNAEQRIWKRLQELRAVKKKRPGMRVGIIGCMAERLKEQLFDEEILDIIVGPDAYRSLPALLSEVEAGQKAANVILSGDETYADVNPVRYSSNGVSAFISIMRGCENFCTYCVVPLTRGKERSRSPQTIIGEVKKLADKGFREVTLLGQNVNSYQWDEGPYTFARLLEEVARISPAMRIRFTTSHPKDLSDELIDTIAAHANICRSVHLAVQSGSNQVLKKMNRNYSREWYKNRISRIKQVMPDCSISTDIIAGFCSETEDDHRQTLSLMEWVPFDFAYMFKYSQRDGTLAANTLPDDVAEEVKKRRLREIIDLQQRLSSESNQRDVGKTMEVLVEGFSKKSDQQLSGRNSQNKVVVFPSAHFKKGDYVQVKINSCTAATLIGQAVL